MHCECVNSIRIRFSFLNRLIWKSFKRLPTAPEWARFHKNARRMRQLGGRTTLSLEVFSILKLRTINEPLLPNLEALYLSRTTEEFIPLIPFVLSPRTTLIDIVFDKPDFPSTIVASMITALPALCPNLRAITLQFQPRDPTITAAVSEILLVGNRNALRRFRIHSPLTEEAREVVCNLPDLRSLWLGIEGSTSLPTLVLPSLTKINIEFDHGQNWLQGFRGATFGKLASVIFRSESEPIGDFLQAFESVALTTSISATLSIFRFHTSRPWRPNYRSLLLFTQLKDLDIGFSCEHGCSSTIDDEIITDIARAMPGLEVLQLGGSPCETPTGVTTKGLAILARCCLHLSRLRIHFQVASLDPPVIPRIMPSGQPTVPRQACALKELDAGEIPMPKESTLMVALTLLRIFPCIEHVRSSDRGEWGKVSDAIDDSKQLVHHSSREPSLTQPRCEANDISPRSHA